ncbi:LOW QUALITY PROTEIN: cathepsin K-like [Xenia sp. Carnegie-2017]|uniref:LOW QUALITY PROTEIN: cathepsin K-like n=1 Tax=Xenia sp. Carnegie-2017 TaxID=2897299 RepID=UPI001F037268|nr:LOW QUALITY PROTEIN: cathepsin K-like [Xenia sp. Carnegie-2017]
MSFMSSVHYVLLVVVLSAFVFLVTNLTMSFHTGKVLKIIRRFIHRHPRPSFPQNYHSTGLLMLPHSGIREPFEIWFSKEQQRSRVDFYYGTDKTYQRSDLGEFGTSFKVVPMYNERRGNFKGCWYRNGTKSVPIVPQPIIPNIEEFEFVDIEVLDGIETSKWRHEYKTYDLNNIYTFWVTRSSSPRPVKYEMKGYDSLLATHYDYYVLEYISFEQWGSNASVFELASDVWCHNWSHKLISHLMTNPMQEFVLSRHLDKDMHLERLYSIFRRRHQKFYKGRYENGRRKHIFRHNLRFIHSTNRKNLNFKLSTNHMADVDHVEYVRYHGSKEEHRYYNHHSNQKMMNDIAVNLTGVPLSLDWRDYGAVGPVTSQGNCASCYALVAAQTIETSQFLKTGNLTTLASQQILDCSWGSGNEGCKGGWYSKAFSWVYLHSLRSEQNYGRYMAQEGSCHSNGKAKVATIDGFAYVPKRNNTALKIALAKYGAAAVSVNANPMTFKFYGWGIYDDPQCDDSDNSHTVVVIGYGVQRGIPYWLIKNSWSESWGIKGYAKIAWDQNRCGITEKPIVVLTKHRAFQLPMNFNSTFERHKRERSHAYGNSIPYI